MMSTYYLVKNSKKPEDIGKIYDFKEINEPKKKYSLKSESNFHTLNSIEAMYLLKINQNQRIKAYESVLFRKIIELKKNKFYKVVADNKSLTMKFLSLIIRNDSLIVQFHIKNSNDMEILANQIKEIEPYEVVENQPRCETSARSLLDQTSDKRDYTPIADGWYILSIKFTIHDIGTIINVNKGKMTTIPDSCLIVSQISLKDNLIKIEEDEALFLSKLPIEKRMKNHDSGKFTIIKNMETNQECFLRNDKTAGTIYKIVNKNIQHEAVTFDLKSKDKSHKLTTNVDASDIKLRKSSKNKMPDYLMETDKNPPFNRQASRTSFNSTDSRGSLKSEKKQYVISCDPIKLKVVDPTKITNIDTRTCSNMDKFILIRAKNNQLVIRLLWKGLVDDIFTLGCELKDYWNQGTDGTFNGVKLFECANKRGVLIPSNKDIKSCEPDDRHNLSDGKGIKDDDICCVEKRESFDKCNVKIGSEIIFGNDSKWKGEIKWIGLVNREECCAVVSKNTLDIFKKSGFMVSLFNIQSYEYNKLAVIRMKDIPTRVACDPIKLNVMNPLVIKHIDKDSYENMEKFLVIRINKNQFVLKLLWKGLVDESICLGCELREDWNHGTDGTFNGVKLFECANKRGVLMPSNKDIKSCGLNDTHKYLYDGKGIKEDDICCVERRESFDKCNVKIGSEIIVGYDEIEKGKIQWIGLINGNECIGIYLLKYGNNYKTNGFTDTLKLFGTSVFSAVLHKINDIPFTIKLSAIDMPVINPTFPTFKFEKLPHSKKELVLRIKRTVHVISQEWRGNVNNQLCIGCAWERKINYGTDGTFGNVKLFECEDKCGFLVKLDNDIGTCATDQVCKKINKTSDAINPNDICCMETLQSLPNHKTITVGQIFQYDNIVRTCVWIGLINGEEAVVVNNGGSWTRNKSPFKYCNLVEDRINWTSIKVEAIESPIAFFRVIYVSNSNTLNKKCLKFTNTSFTVGDIVQVTDDHVICGAVEFFIERLDEVLVGIKLSEGIDHEGYQFLQNVLFNQELFDMDRPGIIVKSKALQLIPKEVQSNPNSSIINKKSIKYKEKCESKIFNKNDLVRPIKGNVNECFRVVDSFLFNGVSCIVAKKSVSIFDQQICFLQEVDVCKLDASKIKTEYYQDTIIDPQSLINFEKCAIEDLDLEDKVKFKLRDSYELYEGSIMFTGRSNGILSAVVQLKVEMKNIAIQYQINEMIGKNIANDPHLPVVIVPASVLHKQNGLDLQKINGITMVNPKLVKVCDGKLVEEKYIIFTSCGTSHTGILKWKGVIDKRFCVGIEIDFDTNWGTNGTFGFKSLFKSRDKRGVLTPIETLEKSCLTGGHKQLVPKLDIIDQSCICCMRSTGNGNHVTSFQINDRIKNKKSTINGTCKWIGLVNNVEVIGVELNIVIENGTDGTFCNTLLFNCPAGCGALFKAIDLTITRLECKYLEDIQLHIIDPSNIRSIENGKEIQKSVIYKRKNMTKRLNVRWRGVVNGDLCVGCELENGNEYGTNGHFLEDKLFHCGDGKAVLISVYETYDSCESRFHHNDIEKQTYWLSNKIEWININNVCCVEWLGHIKKRPHIQIDSRIKYAKWTNNNGGVCKWIGMVNGQEAVGVEMDKDVGGSNGRFASFDLFTCQVGLGVLLDADDISHDIENEKLHFVIDKIVDINKIWIIKQYANKTINGHSIDDPVTTFIKLDGCNKERFNGQVKWLGEINREKCVGLDMEDEFDFGINGVIKGNVKFQCMLRHGVVTLLDTVTRSKDSDTPHFIDEGIIDPNKYLKCQEKWDTKFLEERNIKKNCDVFVIINGSDRQMKMKGVFMWCGFMNGMTVGAVKLDKDHKHGTNGRFWRDQLFKCDVKRAIATPWNSIYQYLPFEQRQIPEEDRVFQEIDINSAVKYYYTADNGVKDLFGTVRWTGVNEDGDYLFGIELDDRLPLGTDGLFKNQRLFHCQNGHGILAELNRVTKDTRFTESNLDPKDVPMSNDSTIVYYSRLAKLAVGEKKGIQGNANSCYFDSSIFALFSSTDVLDYLIHPMVNEMENDEITKQFRDILSRKIVYPLREFGFVSFHKTQEMRDVIQKYGHKFAEMSKQETDMENVSALLTKLCPNDQLLKIISNNGSKTNSMFLQLFLTLEKKKKFMSSEEMLKVSMVQNDIMFNELPTCLIMQAPRDARGINCYDYVIPSDTIEISDICRNYFRKCYKCCEKACFHCKKCLDNYVLDISVGFYCCDHKCHHQEVINIPQSKIQSTSKVFMKLQAIICIEKCHFVAYVKQNINPNENSWYFFDSMSTQGFTDNYAVPKVSKSKEVSHFLNSQKEEMIELINSYGNDGLKRIVKDSYIFVYHNDTKTCY